MVRKPTFAFALCLSLALILTSCGEKDARIAVGHGGGYLSAAVYAAQKELGGRVDVQSFQAASDVAYALISGRLDLGFVEADKLAVLAGIDGFARLTVVGKITYPYGATLVLRKGLDARLRDLAGLTIAASSPNCVLLGEFAADAKRLGADISGARYVYLPFDAMIPALAAKKVDAAVIKGAYSVFALQDGHSILYQNWEVKPGDECCPAVVDQAVLVLLARRDRLDAAKIFVDALASAQKLSPDQLRRAVADNTPIPFEILQGQPVPEFSLAGDELTAIFLQAADEDHAADQPQSSGKP